MSSNSVKRLRKAAKVAGKELVYNRSTGYYQIKSDPSTFSLGIECGRDENGELYIDDSLVKQVMGWLE